MMSTPQRQIKQYFKQIRGSFPVYGLYEKRFFGDFKASVAEFVLLYPNHTFEEIEENFGNPQSIVHTYLANVDATYKHKQIMRAKLIRRGLIGSTAVLLLAVAVFTKGYLH